MSYTNNSGFLGATSFIPDEIKGIEFCTQEDLDRGSAVHAAMAAYLKGLWVAPLQPDWQLYFDSGRRWVDALVDEIILVEERLVDRTIGYSGQLDLLARLKGDTSVTLIDWKTSQSKHRWWDLQLAAYAHLVCINGYPAPNRAMPVRLKKDGKIALSPPGDHLQDTRVAWNAFKGLVVGRNYCLPK